MSRKDQLYARLHQLHRYTLRIYSYASIPLNHGRHKERIEELERRLLKKYDDAMKELNRIERIEQIDGNTKMKEIFEILGATPIRIKE